MSRLVTRRPTSASRFPRRASATPSFLPQLSQISLFPDFESGQFGMDRYSVSPLDTIVSFQSHLQSAYNESRLSQFGLYGLYANQEPLPRRPIRYESLPETLMEGVSQLASISIAKHEPSLKSTSPTLKIRQSARLASSESRSTCATGPSVPSMSSLRKATGSEDLRRNYSGSSFASRSAGQINSRICEAPAPKHSSDHSARSNASIHSVKHFGSFCILDTFVSGCPVTATSEDLRYVFHIGDQFVLNMQECEETSIDVVTGSSPDGDEVIHLVLFSPLLSPSTGMSRFMLAALINVTHFVHEASQLPDLDTTSDESSSEDEIVSPAITPPQSAWSTRSYELLPEDLLGGCSVTAEPEKSPVNNHCPSLRRQKPSPIAIKRESEDIWLALAREERLEQDCQFWASSLTGESPGHNTPQSLRTGSIEVSKSTTTVDKVLDEFISSLQQLYSKSFLLARSPLDDKYYEICSVSPAVYASGEYVSGHLTHTAPEVIEGMSESLGAGTPFRITVRWGSHGIEKRLYCVPLCGQNSMTWICVLVDLHMPVLW
jgi:hypothetical protein